ncbi:MAG: acylphosphatase [Anaerolineae bacterium]
MSGVGRFRAIIHGRVQGVYFRDFTQRHASSLGITGFVRNKFDGTVEVVAEGERQGLENLLDKLRVGPRSARVNDIDLEWEEFIGEFRHFEVRF